jgi:hypothetical protein
MWWSFRKSKNVGPVKLTASKGGVSASKKVKRVTVSASKKRGVTASFKGPFGIRFGL